MSIDTQIRSFLVPTEIWIHGVNSRPDLPALITPAADALDIERRITKGVGLKNETRRYTLCFERMQSIVTELSAEPNCLPTPLVWSASRIDAKSGPIARAYIAVSDTLGLLLSRKSEGGARCFKGFMAPDEIADQLLIAEKASAIPQLPLILDQIAKRTAAHGSDFSVTAEECRCALDARIDLLRMAASSQTLPSGVVDVVELV